MTAWTRSSRCEATSCVEVAPDGDDVLIRDSKDPKSPVLRFTREEWIAFEAGVNAGDFAFFGKGMTVS